MQNVSILGCGWLGKPLAEVLIKNQFSVKGSTTTQSKMDDFKSLGIKPFMIDISERKDFSEFLESDILVIAITSKNIEDFKFLISQIEKSPIQKVLFISSTSVYPDLNTIMSEADEIQDNALSRIEAIIRQQTSFQTTILRFAGLLGYDRHPGNWFKKGRIIPHPEGYVNMIHRDDCIGIIEQIIDQNAWGKLYNACSNHHPTRKEFYSQAKLSLGLEVPIFEDESPLSWKIISADKVQKELNYQFKYDNLLELLISKTIE